MKELLEVKNLSVSYQQKVVSDVSMTLHRQEIVGLIGQNGCGKSTLLKGIIGGPGFNTRTSVCQWTGLLCNEYKNACSKYSYDDTKV